jgi:predicted hydrocarbon binding protein
MIAIAKLIQDDFLPGNFFAPDAYIQGDIESGLIENRNGERLVALPDTFLEAIYAACDRDLGSATGIVLFKCGHWWGKNFYRRFATQILNYYGKSLGDMETIEFLQCFKECWKTHGWGLLDFDANYYQKGFLVLQVTNSAFAKASQLKDRPSCSFEAGIFSAFFSEITGRTLHCVQISCESMGEDSNYFIVALEDRLQPVEKWLEEKRRPQEIFNLLSQIDSRNGNNG